MVIRLTTLSAYQTIAYKPTRGWNTVSSLHSQLVASKSWKSCSDNYADMQIHNNLTQTLTLALLLNSLSCVMS